MTLVLSGAQTMLRDMLSSYLADNYSFEQRRKYLQSSDGWSRQVWHALARELEVLGAGFPESAGGMGGDAIDTMVIAEELGAVLSLEPFWSSVVVAGAVLRQADDARSLAALKRVIRGEMTIGVGLFESQGRFDPSDVAMIARRGPGEGFTLSGGKVVVRDAPLASHLMVTATAEDSCGGQTGVSIFLVERNAPGVTLATYRLIDGGHAATLYFNDVLAPPDALVGVLHEGLPLIERAIDEGAAALCAEALGLLRQMYAHTVDYVKQRRQFGQHLSDFQVVRHRIAEMFIEIEQARSAAWIAVSKLGLPRAARICATSAALACVLQALRFVGQNAIQLHGGVGTTDELAVGHFFKRSITLARQLGTVEDAFARFNEAVFDAD